MKKLENAKTAELITFTILALHCAYYLRFDAEVAAAIAASEATQKLAVLLWIVLAAMFFTIFLDFVLYIRENAAREALAAQLRSDALTGLTNRFGCDAIIEFYKGKKLPDGFACAMVEMNNLAEINDEFGRDAGDDAIRDFSDIIGMTAAGHCFVGRNGGNKYMAIFEKDGHTHVETFLKRLEDKVSEYNALPNTHAVSYAVGKAFAEETEDRAIHSLIRLSDQTISAHAVSEE